ncbi:MAG: hypothetical protein AAGM21_02090 [Pseudomonadota bacterium]
MPSNLRLAVLGAALLAAPPGAATPLSAIDWLSQSIEAPGTALGRAADAPAGRMPATVSMQPLGAPKPETPGLVAAADLGLPGDLWSGSTAEDAAARLAVVDATLPPNARDLLRRMLISRQAAPLQGDDTDVLTAARVDVLLQMGALDEARLLLGARAPQVPELFRRWFDIALLTGSETEACRDMAERPEVSPTYPARIFCLARNGDWHVAALTLGSAESLGILSDAEDALLARFLDPELFEDVPPAPRRPTPLVFRLYEASGERLSTLPLPVAFAHADLAPILGWKTRIEASERLARAGVLGPGDLFAVYGEETAAASGGVWERIAAVADLNAALDRRRAEPQAYHAAFRTMAAAGLGHVFAAGYRDLPDDPGDDPAVRRSLLTMAAMQGRRILPQAYLDPASRDDAFLAALAAGDPAAAPAPDLLARAISTGFQRNAFDGPLATLDAQGRKGEALLVALGWIDDAAQGDADRLAEALSYLRGLGLDETARRIALDLVVAGRAT